MPAIVTLSWSLTTISGPPESPIQFGLLCMVRVHMISHLVLCRQRDSRKVDTRFTLDPNCCLCNKAPQPAMMYFLPVIVLSGKQIGLKPASCSSFKRPILFVPEFDCWGRILKSSCSICFSTRITFRLLSAVWTLYTFRWTLVTRSNARQWAAVKT